MRRFPVLWIVLGAGVGAAIWLLLQTPGSLTEALSNPVMSILGTQHQLNSTLLDVSENSDTVRAAGRRLLQPFGNVRLIRLFETPDPDTSKKNQ